MSKISNQDLIREAIEARENAYTPYSHFCVGAALLSKDGRVFRGCNIENAGYTPSNCAERTAFFKAVSEGVREFEKIAIVAGPKDGQLITTAPCGVCRQVMMEFCEPDFPILLAKSPEEYEEWTLERLLPFGFGPKDLA